MSQFQLTLLHFFSPPPDDPNQFAWPLRTFHFADRTDQREREFHLTAERLKELFIGLNGSGRVPIEHANYHAISDLFDVSINK